MPDVATRQSDGKTQSLQSEVIYKSTFQSVTKKIFAATNLDDILIGLKTEIAALFTAKRLTIYYVDGIKRELVSRFKSGHEIKEIRVPLSPKSIAGYSAFRQTLINIQDAQDPQELKAIDPALEFDESWDEQSGFKTAQVLVVPIVFKKMLLGAIQFVNRMDGAPFSKEDEKNAIELSETLGIGLYNQKRMAAGRGARKNKYDTLLENHLLTQKELKKIINDARDRKEPVETVMMKDYKVPKKDIGASLSKYYDVPFVQFSKNTPIPGDLLTGLKVPFLKRNIWVPLRREDDHIVIAINDPHDLQKGGGIKSLFPGETIKFNIAFEGDILEFIGLFTQDEQEIASIDDILSQLADDDLEMEEDLTSMDEESSVVVQLVNKIILDAQARNASDIHIEPYPGRNNTQVRIRVDGACTLYQTIPYQYKNAVVSRIKIMSDLDIAERRLPQDGKIKFKKYGGLDIELRVATVPTQGGMEDVVMRLLAAGEPIPLDKIGFSKFNYDHFLGMVTQPYGIIFVCGPTGSGKTTTLHSALSYINKTETKIWTAEDPVEITQKGLRQVQVKPKIGFNFAAAMRSFLRADPDVIMVGEMRDKETTQIGIEASLTGHLVLSTLHTNSAPESITRLLDMGMDPFNFADAILGIMAQRLVRTLCKSCKKPYHPGKEEFDELIREHGKEQFDELNIQYTKDLQLFKPDGCDACSNTGYRGRMGIHELLAGSDNIKRLIQQSATIEEIRALALKEGMRTLKQDGISKIFQGNCDLLQVRKVCIK